PCPRAHSRAANTGPTAYGRRCCWKARSGSAVRARHVGRHRLGQSPRHRGCADCGGGFGSGFDAVNLGISGDRFILERIQARMSANNIITLTAANFEQEVLQSPTPVLWISGPNGVALAK